MGQKLIYTIQQLYTNATSAVFAQGAVGKWFHTTVGVRQGCLLSPTLFNIFLERIMSDALDNHEGTVSIGGRTITNLRFADDIDGLAGEENELTNLVNQLDRASTKYGMEISAEKTKLMTNDYGSITADISVHGQKLETVQQFKYLGAIISDQGSKSEILARAAQTMTALSKLKTIMEGQKYLPATQDQTPTCLGFHYIPVCLRNMDTYSRAAEEDTGTRNEMLSHHTGHLVYGPHHQ